MADDVLANPIWSPPFNVRDPSVFRTSKGYRLFYSRFSGTAWSDPANWSVHSVFTADWITFSDDQAVTTSGYASPGDLVKWHDRLCLPFQNYPSGPVRLHYSVADSDLEKWSKPDVFLEEAATLPWNTLGRVIDPTWVVDGSKLHCFFVGSKKLERGHGNLLGHAVTTDPDLRNWTILTDQQPLLGTSAESFDGVENVTVFKAGAKWLMIYSEGLDKQHLAYMDSDDLDHWTRRGAINLPVQRWMCTKYGAPFVWQENDQFKMILMGTDAKDRTSFGLLTSPDGVHWTPLPERKAL